MNIDKRALDDYITGSRYSEELDVIACPSCSEEYDVILCREYGATYFKLDEPICPHCGKVYNE